MLITPVGGSGGGASATNQITVSSTGGNLDTLLSDMSAHYLPRLSNWFKGGITGKKIAIVGDSTSNIGNATQCYNEFVKLTQPGQILGGCQFKFMGSSGLTAEGWTGTNSGATYGVDGAMTAASTTFTSALANFTVNDVGKNIRVSGAASTLTTVATAGAITAGTYKLTVTGASFVSGDVGKIIMVAGAGAGGATLFTYIAAWTSSTVVTLADQAVTTVSAQTVRYGTGSDLSTTITGFTDAHTVTLGAAATGTVASATFSYYTTNSIGTGLGDGLCDNGGSTGCKLIDLIAYQPDIVIPSFGINSVRTAGATQNQLTTYMDKIVNNIHTVLPNADVLMRMPNSIAQEDITSSSHYVVGITPQAATDILYNTYKSFYAKYAWCGVLNTMDTIFGRTSPTIGQFDMSASFTDGVASSASTTFTSATAPFASTDVGKSILLIGAGPGAQNYLTTISTFTNSSTVVLAATPYQSVNPCTFVFGTLFPNASLMTDQLHPNYGYVSLARLIAKVLQAPAQATFTPTTSDTLFPIGIPYGEPFNIELANNALSRDWQLPYRFYPRVLEDPRHYQLIALTSTALPGASTMTLAYLGDAAANIQAGDIFLFYDDLSVWDTSFFQGMNATSSAGVTVINYTSGRGPGQNSVSDAVMVAGSTRLNSPTGGFQPWHIGAAVTVAGAGVSGATLSSRIIEVLDNNNVRLFHQASTAVTTVAATWGTVAGSVTGAGGLVGVYRPLDYNDPILAGYQQQYLTYLYNSRLQMGSGNDSGQWNLSKLDYQNAYTRTIKASDVVYSGSARPVKVRIGADAISGATTLTCLWLENALINAQVLRLVSGVGPTTITLGGAASQGATSLTVSATSAAIKQGAIYVPDYQAITTISAGTITTAANHGLVAGDSVAIYDTQGGVPSGVYKVNTAPTGTTFTLVNATTSTYNGGGYICKRSYAISGNTPSISGTQITLFTSSGKFTSLGGTFGYLFSTRRQDYANAKPQECIRFSYPSGTITNSNAVLARFLMSRNGLYGAFQAFLNTAPTGGTAVFLVKKNGTLVATLTFASASQTATITWASGSNFSANWGDKMTIECDSTSTGTGMSDLSVAFDID